MRVAIIGLYNSGSSVLSQIMDKLGFEIGHPLWVDHYESRSLRKHLIEWWDEPRLVETVSRRKRVAALKRWMKQHEAKNPMVCAKHPLLCLSAEDVEQAWGPEVKFIRAARPLEQSIAGLEKREWFGGETRRIQTTLHDAAEAFFSERDHHQVAYETLLADPANTVQELVSHLGLFLPEQRIEEAASVVRQ